jgi:hypothetical protein
MLESIVDLGEKINRKLELKSTSDDFATICFNELREFQVDKTLKEFDLEVSEWLSNTKLPIQLNVHNGFGQPPITLYNNGTFVVDIYFWMHADTSIHSHAFSGAFKVLYGRSIHEIYTVEKIKEYSSDVMQTDISRTQVDVLYPNDTNKILAGDDFCHRVVHLEAPTVTLCIRTVNDLTIPQWHHFENGLSILKRELSESVYKRLFFSEYLITRTNEEGLNYLVQYIRSLQDSEVMNLFEQLTIDSMGLCEQTTELIYTAIMDTYKDKEWFLIYEEYCLWTENHIHPQGDSPSERFYTHAVNTSYPVELRDKLFHEVESYLL